MGSLQNMGARLGRAGAAACLALAGWLAMSEAAFAGVPGEQLFVDNCSACHQRTGAGIPGAFPPLKGAKLVLGEPRILTATVLNGRGGMPAFKTNLSDAELAQILTYVRGAWGNKAKPIAAAEVAKGRSGGAPPAARLQMH